jgi:DNA-binding NarL/FixJ family response regulator
MDGARETHQAGHPTVQVHDQEHAVIRVLIADDQAMVRSGLAMVLGADDDIEVVGEARDGAEVTRLAHTLRPDVTLMDIRMPGVDGIEATRQLTSAPTPPTVVVMLTTFGAEDHVVEALRAGAVGFVLKDSDPDTLLGAVHAAAAGGGLLDPAVTRQVVARFAAGGARTVGAPPPELGSLTERERAVLDELARGASNAEIAERLFVESSTVKTHVVHVLRKLQLRDRVEAVIYAYEHGLVEPGDGVR